MFYLDQLASMGDLAFYMEAVSAEIELSPATPCNKRIWAKKAN